MWRWTISPPLTELRSGFARSWLPSRLRAGCSTEDYQLWSLRSNRLGELSTLAGWAVESPGSTSVGK
jgi:hypothetical protein